MSEQKLIDFDLPCTGCGYNLRGLPRDHACPECGLRIPWFAGSANAAEIVEEFDQMQERLARTHERNARREKLLERHEELLDRWKRLTERVERVIDRLERELDRGLN